MRSLSLVYLLLLAGLIISLPSCTEDGDPIIDPPLGPSVSLIADIDFLTGDATLSAGETFKVRLQAFTGDNQLNTISVTENGTAIAHTMDRIKYNGQDDDANPKLLFNADRDGFTWDIEVIAHADGLSTYEFIVTDEAGNNDAVSLNITIQSLPLLITQVGGTNVINTMPSNLVNVMVMVQKGANPLKNITVYQDGISIADLTRLRFKDIATNFTANPMPLTGDDVNGFSGEIYIRARATAGTNIYTIEVEDEGGEFASLDLTFISGTPIDNEFTAILVSNADGENDGGLDLDAGISVPADSVVAEIRDLGIDLNQQTDRNWIQKIEPVNGAILRAFDPATIENFDFDAVTTKEAVIGAYDNSADISQSEVVNMDDLFTVRRGDDYFLLKVTKVEVTAADNDDFYEFSVKQALQ